MNFLFGLNLILSMVVVVSYGAVLINNPSTTTTARPTTARTTTTTRPTTTTTRKANLTTTSTRPTTSTTSPKPSTTTTAKPTTTKSLANVWLSFKASQNLTFNSTEDPLRLALFNKARASIDVSNNQPNKTYKLALNQFAIWTTTELKSLTGTVAPSNGSSSNNNSSPIQQVNVTQGPHGEKIPILSDSGSFDLRSSGCLSAVRNQGRCGSCWAFSAVATLEFAFCKVHNQLIPRLSEQQLVDCETFSYGCNGGYSDYALLYLRNGADSYLYYPYTARTGRCNFKSNGIAAYTNNVYKTKAYDVNTMMYAVGAYGPLVAYMYVATDFYSYGNGIYMNAGACSNRNINHAVNIVGYGTTSGVNYWIVRNSWGLNWGVGGYFYIQRGTNMCSIETYVYLATAK